MIAGLYRFFSQHRWLLAVMITVLTGVLLFLAAQIKIEEDITRLFPDDPKVEKLNKVFNNWRFSERITLIVSEKDTSHPAQPDSLIAFADTLYSRLNKELSEYVTDVQYRMDEQLMFKMHALIQSNLPIYLEDEDYRKIDSLLAPLQLKSTLQNQLKILMTPAGATLRKMLMTDPLGITYLPLKRFREYQQNGQFKIISDCIFSKDERNLLLFIYPSTRANETRRNSELISRLNNLISDMQSETYSVEYFGTPAIAVANARQIKRDIYFTLGITLLVLIVFIGFFFRSKLAPLIMLLPVLFGVVFSLAMVVLIQGTISGIAIGAGAVVLGIAVNYSLHIFTHYRQTPQMEAVIAEVAHPMLLGMFTTAGAFFFLQVLESQILQDFGLFAGFALTGALFFSLVVLPHCIPGSSAKQNTTNASGHTLLDKLSTLRPEYNYALIGAILLITGVLAFFATRVSFDGDMTKLNFMDKKLKEAEARLNRLMGSEEKKIAFVSTGATLNKALQNSKKLQDSLDSMKQQHIIKNYSSVSGIIPSWELQQERIRKWENFWRVEKIQQTQAALTEAASALKFREGAFNDFLALLDRKFEPITPDSLLTLPEIFGDYVIRMPGFSAIISTADITPGQRENLFNRILQTNDNFILDKQLVTAKFIEIIRDDFNLILGFTSLFVLFMLYAAHARIELALITFIPMTLSWIWILGLMGLTHLNFNIVNIILCTFIFGLGDDFSIFITDGLIQEYKAGKKSLSSIKVSNYLAAITVILSLGALLFAGHPALKSIAFTAIIGLFCVLFISQTLIPFFFRILITNRTAKGLRPLTASGIFISAFAFTYFVIGSFLLTLLGLVTLYLLPLKKEKCKYLFHVLLCKFVWSLVYLMVHVKKKYIGLEHTDFSKPAIFICNHQSFLDILVTVMTHPKLILLVNDWVYHSPVFGKVVKMADYYWIGQGAENSLEHIRERVKNGYSVVIFPEGTRSPDGVIRRFHKGAFYLSEKLNLDIQPFLLHGTGDRMKKGDFLLTGGPMTMKFLPRISPRDLSYGTSYSERAKNINRYFRQEYDKLKAEIESPQYYSSLLISNYLYKGPVVEWYIRVKIKLENYYHPYHAHLPRNASIVDLGCGYGYTDYLLYFASNDRKIIAVDYDREKITVASHCFSANPHVRFYCDDIRSFPLPRADAFILNDVLHYLKPDEQEHLILKCMRHLNENGKIFIKDADAGNRQRHLVTRLTEIISTGSGFNRKSKSLYFVPLQKFQDIAENMGYSIQIISESPYTSNKIMIVSKSTASITTGHAI